VRFRGGSALNGKQLFWGDGKPVMAKGRNGQQLWCCETCGSLKLDQESADKCCVCSYCDQPIEQDKIGKGDYSYIHGKCSDEREREREAARIEKAEKLDSWDGPVQWDGVRGGWGDGFFSSLDELIESLEDDDDDDGAELPEYVWCCKEAKRARISLSSVLENLAEDMYEDAADNFQGVDELQAAVDKFNELNKSVISWEPNYKRMVRVPQRVSNG
jgi:hypothetical protein